MHSPTGENQLQSSQTQSQHFPTDLKKKVSKQTHTHIHTPANNKDTLLQGLMSK